ncbi:MAG: S9 family peptidase [Gemmatimonadetes bacterium]|nr:S9 family peptidase [Gemmatimonadota bacterium]
MRRTTVLTSAALAAGAGLLVAQTPVANRLTMEDYLEAEAPRDFFRGGGPEISPDGKQIAYSRWWVDKMSDRWRQAIWLINADGTRNRWLVDAGGHKWSPDGTRLAFVKQGEPAGAQIFVRYMDAEGATSQITRVETGAGNLAWSPEGRWIAYTAMVPEPSKWSTALPGKPAGAQWAPPPKVIDRYPYRADWAGYTDLGRSQIFVVPATGGTSVQLTDGPWNHGQLAWSRDGREILFGANRVPNADNTWRESDIYAVSVATKTVRQLTTRKGPDGGPVVSPDGRLVAYQGHDWTDDTYIANKLYLMGIDGSNPRQVDGSLDRSAENVAWAPDGSGLYFIAQDRGQAQLFFASVAGGEPRRLTTADQVLTGLSLAPNGTAALIQSTFTQPGDIAVIDLKAPAPAVKRVTDLNGDILTGKRLGSLEEIWYPSVEGLRVQGWVVKPPDFDPRKKYPLMLAIHGGPHSMYASSLTFMWWEWQIYAGMGYLVLFTNPRGSSGYGSAFGNAIKNAYPGKDYDDLMAGVDTVIKRGYVDTNNMFVYGCSGGGVLTAWVVGHTDRFAAASSECPVINWLSFVGTTDGAGWYRNFAKLPWEDPSEHLRRSPLMYVGNVKTPTMLLTPEGDLRTPMPQTEEYYAALKMRQVPTVMVRLQDEWHAYFNRPSNFLHTISFREKWFQTYKKSSAPVP